MRSARLALLQYKDGEKRYIIAPVGLQGGREDFQRPGGAAGNRQLPSAQGDSGRPAPFITSKSRPVAAARWSVRRAARRR